ncbi:MAG: antitoxin Xre/MbcA/ParS toxin-binding domain-containing protein [Pseudomonadota bacterium]
MKTLEAYAAPDTLPTSEPARIGRLLGLKASKAVSDVDLADKVAKGLKPTSANALASILGQSVVVGPIVPEATLRRARNSGGALSREMSERLYEVGRVVDAVSRTFHGDKDAINHFLNHPHTLLDGRTPLDMARSSSAGADAVMNLLRRAESGFAV